MRTSRWAGVRLLLVLLFAATAVGRAGAQGGKPAIEFGDRRFDFPLATLTFSPDRKLLVTADYSHKAQALLVDVRTRQVVHRLDGHSGYVNQIRFSPDGRRIYT